MLMEVDEDHDVISSSSQGDTTKFAPTSMHTDKTVAAPPIPVNLPDCANASCTNSVAHSLAPNSSTEIITFLYCSPSCRNRCLRNTTELLKGDIANMEQTLCSMKTSLKGFACLNKTEKPKSLEKPKTPTAPSSGKGNSVAHPCKFDFFGPLMSGQYWIEGQK